MRSYSKRNRKYTEIVRESAKSFTTEIGGHVWEQPSLPYQLKCLNWTQEAYTALNAQDQLEVGDIFETTGLMPMIEEPIS